MPGKLKIDLGVDPVIVGNADGRSAIVLVCEHASNRIPEAFANLGLDEIARASHVAWDPGALAVANKLSGMLDATLVSGGVSRLLYDCNRPPDAPDAIPERSEVFDIPGNVELEPTDREQRVAAIYEPFRDTLAAVIAGRNEPAILVTIHSFTPVYLGKPRSVEIGILHDDDSRLADEMLRLAPENSDLNFQRNKPYGANDGVTHTLKVHSIQNGTLNVMIEIRNDLIDTEETQTQIAETIGDILMTAVANLKLPNRGIAVS